MELSTLIPWLRRFKAAPPATADVPSTAPEPRPDELLNEQAVGQVLAAFSRAFDADKLLNDAGLQRHQLAALLSDDEIDGALETRRDAAVAVPWSLEPATGPAAEFITEQLKAHAVPILKAAWNAVPFGYAVAERIYRQQEDGRIGLAAVIEKPMQWFEPKRDGTLFYYAVNSASGVPVDTSQKFLMTRRDPTHEHPYGKALLSRLYWPYLFRHNGWRFWMQFLERFGDPLLIGKSVKPGELVAKLRDLGILNVIAVGLQDELTAVTMSGSGEFERVEQAICRRIQKLVLGQTLTSDTQGVGSQALGRVHNEVRMDKRDADVRLITPALQNAIDALLALNFPGQQIVVTLADDTGLQPERAERDATLLTAGGIRLTEQYYLRTYDYTEGDLTIPEPPAPPDPNAPPAKPGTQPGTKPAGKLTAELAAQSGLTGNQAALDALATGAQEDLPPPLDPALIRRAVLGARDPADLEQRLAALLGSATTADYQTALERALFTADVLGYIGASEDSSAALSQASQALPPQRRQVQLTTAADGTTTAEIVSTRRVVIHRNADGQTCGEILDQ